MLKKVDIFTDGSCLGNPGPGGYGVILCHKQHQSEFSQGFFMTTNNRMEMLAAIVGLTQLKAPCDVNLYTDSQYLKNGVTTWLAGWQKNGWQTANRKAVKNIDLWRQLVILLEKHTIAWHWVKGHAGHIENERCDILAREAAMKPQLEDAGFKSISE